MSRTKLSDPKNLMYRNVHPKQLQDGRPSSDAFVPGSNDEGQLSVDQSALVSAEQSFRIFTEGNGLKSDAVFGVTVGEFQAVSITCYEDPIIGSAPAADNPAHCLADYTELASKNQRRKTGVLVRNAAVQRGACFVPGD